MRKLYAKWVPKCLNADQNRQRCNSSEQILDFFFWCDPMISSHDWWPWTKLGYITITRRQSNNQWSGGIAAHPAPPPKNSECKNPLEKFSPWFFGIKKASYSLIIFQRAKLSTRSITYFCWCNWMTFWRKNAKEVHKVGLVLARQCPGSPGTCNPEETGLLGLPVSWSPTLFSGSGPVGLPPVPWTKKENNWKVAIFRPTQRSLPPRRPGWTDKFLIFFEWLAKVGATR